jgi:hypothetical protein
VAEARVDATYSWVKEHFYAVVSALGTALLACTGAFVYFDPQHPERFKTWVIGFLVVGVLGTIWGIVGSDHRQSDRRLLEAKNSSLEDELERSKGNYYEAFHNYLVYLGSEVLQLSTSDRVTVYTHDENRFVRLDRYSPNYQLEQPGRTFYPVKHGGVITDAWNDGKRVINGIPDSTESMSKYLSDLKDRQRIPNTVGRKLLMKSRSLAAFRIPKTRDSGYLGVVVFESTEDNTFTETQANDVLIGHARTLAFFMGSMNLSIPDPTLAEKRGL